MNIPFHNLDRPANLFTREGLQDYLDAPKTAPATLTETQYAALSDDDRTQYDRARLVHINGGIVIATPALRMAMRQLEQCFTANLGRNSGQTGMMINGPATIGKTETTKALMGLVYTQFTKQFPRFKEDGIIPVVYVSVPADCTGKTLMRSFASFLGLPVAERETMGETRRRVINTLQAARTQLIVVDELQNLNGRGTKIGESIDLLKNLHNELPATFVYAGFGLDDPSGILRGDRGRQLGGRFTVFDITAINWSRAEDRKTWLQIITAFEKALLLRHQPAGSLRKEAEYLHHRTNGSIGSLARLLTLSASTLIRDPKILEETITVEIMETITLDKIAELHYKKHVDHRATKTAHSARRSTIGAIAA
jgi:hypothetical protein